MRALVDTHALIWWLAGDPRLSRSTRAIIDDKSNQIMVSAASAWEITTKYRIGKLPHSADIAADVLSVILKHGFQPVAVTMAHAQRAGSIQGPDRDPFDRMLAAQAQIEGFPIVSNDRVFDRFGVRRVW